MYKESVVLENEMDICFGINFESYMDTYYGKNGVGFLDDMTL